MATEKTNVLGSDLTGQERAILYMYSQGDNGREIAAKTIYTERSVYTTLARAKRKLGAKTLDQAVYLALQMGVIE